jgi:amidohydrolase
MAHQERATAQRLLEELRAMGADRIVERLAGNGIAAVVEGRGEGPTVLLRADMDALPIAETNDVEHRSRTAGVAHKCGHDGHMAMAIGAARRIARARPGHGRVVVLFQPAEETGEGAAAVLADPAFAPLRPDVAVAVHNLPGFDAGAVVIRSGTFACASRGLVAELRGSTSHAAEPERGRSPALAVAQLIEAWSAARQVFTGLGESTHATVIHAAVGRPAFGTSPGDGRVMATLRAATEASLDHLDHRLRRLAASIADAWELELELEGAEPFPATINEPSVVAEVTAAARSCGLAVVEPEHPLWWSEDFGHFCRLCPAALVGLGAGAETHALHHPSYDFPDDLLPIGVQLLESIARRYLGDSV